MIKATALGPLAIVAGGGSAWVAVGGDPFGTITRYDASASAQRSATVGWAPAAMAMSGSDLWVVDSIGDGSRKQPEGQNAVTLLDPDQLTVTWTAQVTSPGRVATTGSYAWVVSSNSTLVRLDATSRQAGMIADLGSGTLVSGIGALGDSVWVAADLNGAGSVLGLDGTTGHTTVTIKAAGAVGGLACDGTDCYAIVQPALGAWFLAAVRGAALQNVADLPAGVDAGTLSVAGGHAWVGGEGGAVLQVSLQDCRVVALGGVASTGGVVAIAPDVTRLWVLLPDRILAIALGVSHE